MLVQTLARLLTRESKWEQITGGVNVVRSTTLLVDYFFLDNKTLPKSSQAIPPPIRSNMEGLNGFTSVNGATTQTYSEAPTGTKRKRESKSAPKFYAVRVGKQAGIYHSWPECLDQVRGYPKAAFKSFTSLTDAQAYLNNESGSSGGAHGSAGPSKFYGVQSGKNPGVYTSWPEVLEQITGWKGPKHKVFKTRTEAELFVAEGQHQYQGPIGMNMNGPVSVGEGFDLSNTPSAKKVKTGKSKKGGMKDENSSPGPMLEAAEYDPGEAPLPEDAEDHFDTGIILDQSTGTTRYKTAAEFSKTKFQACAPVMDSPIRIYTDGSALSNGTASSIGGIGVYFGPKDRRNISEPLAGTKQTNQRAELTAILRALEVAPRDRRIVIFSDSNYAIKCVTEWYLKWRGNEWLNSARKPVENRDLIQKVLDMLDERFRLNKHRLVDYDEDDDDAEIIAVVRGPWEKGPAGVKFVWVKGHAKDEGNNAADQLAVDGARVARELGEDVELD